MVDVCVRCKQMQRAWGLVKEMIEGEEGPKPDNFTFSTLVKGIRPREEKYTGKENSREELERALRLLSELRKKGYV